MAPEEDRGAKDVETGETGKNVGFNLAVSAILFFLIYGSLFAWGVADGLRRGLPRREG